MELILVKDVEKVGQKGDVIKVRDGFARNFLLPRKLAIPSTRTNQKFVAEQKERASRRQEKERQNAQTVADRLAQAKAVIEANAGENEKLFGSVTAEDICEALNRQGFDFHRKQIFLKESIRSLGTHQVAVEIYPQIKAAVTVEVVRKS